MKKKDTFTPAEFAKKTGISRATVYRWMSVKKYSLYLKMYDAEVVEFGGKKFIRTVK